MSSKELKRCILDALADVKGSHHRSSSSETYKNILRIVNGEKISITKNNRGYWFDLNNVSVAGLQQIYRSLLECQVSSKVAISTSEV
jgi:hypothetical protein